MTLLNSIAPATVVSLGAKGALTSLVEQYGGRRPLVLDAILHQAYDDLAASTVVIEHRYIDRDYRDEFSRHYSKNFRRYASVADRMHFFRGDSPSVPDDPTLFPNLTELEYLGFSVVRPVAGAPVGRTLMRPPPLLEPFVTCKANDVVTVLGREQHIAAAPFMAQDGQFSVCAHVNAWAVAYYHHCRFGSRRLLPGDIVDAVPHERVSGRAIPSVGLTAEQLAEALRRVDLSPLHYPADRLPPGTDLLSLACLYLRSGFPVIVGTSGHAYMLVGYRRRKTVLNRYVLEFILHDDERGPYRVVTGRAEAKHWRHLFVPLPEKLYMPGEVAEEIGSYRMRARLATSQHPTARALVAELARWKFRTTAVLSKEFKSSLQHRGFLPYVTAQYQLIRMPRWIWVVELLDPDRAERGEPSVIGEVVLDSTDHTRELNVLAWRMPGEIGAWDPDVDELGTLYLTGEHALVTPIRPHPNEQR